jgi:hypothetical protein
LNALLEGGAAEEKPAVSLLAAEASLGSAVEVFVGPQLFGLGSGPQQTRSNFFQNNSR